MSTPGPALVASMFARLLARLVFRGPCTRLAWLRFAAVRINGWRQIHGRPPVGVNKTIRGVGAMSLGAGEGTLTLPHLL